MTLDQVKVKIPASTANLGPGFDCLAIALDIYNTVAVQKSESFSIAISGEGANVLSQGHDNRVYQGITTFYERVGRPIPNLEVSCQNDIPLRRGLGSSAAAALGGLVAANLLCGEPLTTQELLRLGVLLEGHPDNIAAALLGGCQVSIVDDANVVTARVPLSEELRVVLFIPDFEIPTEEARSILPQEISRADAIYNISRAALLVAALASGELDHLKVATQDKLHQPARQSLFPAMRSIFAAALSTGAVGVFLSGAGPAILAFTKENEVSIGEAMREAARKASIGSKVRIAYVSSMGAHRVA